MSVTTGLAIYFIVWWMVLFAVLPWGVRSQLESGQVVHCRNGAQRVGVRHQRAAMQDRGSRAEVIAHRKLALDTLWRDAEELDAQKLGEGQGVDGHDHSISKKEEQGQSPARFY